MALEQWRPLSEDGRIFGLSREGVSSLIKRLSKRIGFQFSPHDIRRGAGSYMAENNIPDRIVRKQLGIRTHSVYQRYTERASLKALDKLWDD